MKMSCILEGLKEKKYIKFEKYTPPIWLRTFKTYKIESLVGKKLKEKLIEAINKDDEYIICNKDNNAIIIAKIEDIDTWTKETLIEETTHIKTGYPITKQLADYIRSKNYSLFPACYETGGYKIINNKVQNKRIKKEREIEEKAIRLLKCLQ